MEYLYIENLEVLVERKPKRKVLSIYLSPKKPITVKASLKTPNFLIIRFLHERMHWIQKNLKKFQQIEEKFPQKRIIENETFPYLGKYYELKIVITPHLQHFISLSETNIHLHVPHIEWNTNSKNIDYSHYLEHLRHFYKREAISVLSEKVNFWALKMDLKPSQLKFREQRCRWGSCSSKKVINLNWRLIIFEEKIIDYVIIHELSHLQHLNHSSRFWELVETYCPEYKVLNRKLKQNHLMTSFLDPENKPNCG